VIDCSNPRGSQSIKEDKKFWIPANSNI